MDPEDKLKIKIGRRHSITKIERRMDTLELVKRNHSVEQLVQLYPVVYNFYPSLAVLEKLMTLITSKEDLDLWEGFKILKNSKGEENYYPKFIDVFE